MERFDFSHDYKLENEHVLLRPMELQDFEHLKIFAVKEPNLWTYSLISASGEDNMKLYVEAAVRHRLACGSYPFIVYDKRKEAYAGSSRFYDIQIFNDTTQLGYTWYGKDFQGTGLNKHCKFLMLNFAFDTMSMQRVEFRADYNNKRSIAAMKSLGCVEEGILRSNCKSLDGRRDSIILSILRDEWYAGIKGKLKKKIEQLST